jgi:hypothetical protein
MVEEKRKPPVRVNSTCAFLTTEEETDRQILHVMIDGREVDEIRIRFKNLSPALSEKISAMGLETPSLRLVIK